jgi:NitT/TauT family transport system ATP-binding protein
MTSAPVVEFRRVSKWFAKDGRRTLALDGAELAIEEGQFVSVVGPSGCGKSTLLNLAAGLSAASGGDVLYRGRPVAGINTAVGYITQRDNLLPWATVYDNIVLGLRIRKVPKERQRELADRYLALTGLAEFASHFPEELSGGMRKRAALARTLIYSPEMVLMDEPFSALDAHVKVIMHEELLRMWEQERTTILFITHDLEEAITLSDRIFIMSARPGRVKMSMDIDLPRPRDAFNLHTTPEFNAIYATLWESLKDDIRKGIDV